jgi:hypothetical protein
MRKVLIGTAVLMIGGLTLPKALASPSTASSTTCGGSNTDVQLTISRTVLWPPNHKMIPITITASDTDHEATGESVKVMIGTITNNDETNPPNAAEINGTGQTDVAPGDQTGSMQTQTFDDPGQVVFNIGLAAERSGHDTGSGRTYSIPVTCTESGSMGLPGTEDDMGSSTLTVFVPHDQGQK